MKISTYILITFLFIVMLFSITAFINFRLSKDVSEGAEFMGRSTQVVRLGARFQRNVITMENGLRGYLITGRPSFIRSYDSAEEDNKTILFELPLLVTDSVQMQRLREIGELNREWTQQYTEPLRAAKKNSVIGDSDLVSFNKLYKEKYATGIDKDLQAQLQNRFRDFTTYEYELRDRRKLSLTVNAERANRYALLLTAISLVAGFLLLWFLLRRINTRIDDLRRMAGSIAAGEFRPVADRTYNDELTSVETALQQMAGKLSTNIDLLKEKNEELDQFAHIVSHDLKAPLRGIDNVINWMEEDHPQLITGKIREYMDLIKGRVLRAENLINGLLAYARTGKKQTQQEEIDLNEMLQNVCESLGMIREARIDIEALPTIRGERILLFQIFSNLLSNAVVHNDKPQPELYVWAEDLGNSYWFHVKDNGPGIDPTYFDKIFVIFQTLQERDSFESTGVGLAIVKKIIEKKGGKIWVDSAVGEGSTFSFTWPKQS